MVALAQTKPLRSWQPPASPTRWGWGPLVIIIPSAGGVDAGDIITEDAIGLELVRTFLEAPNAATLCVSSHLDIEVYIRRFGPTKTRRAIGKHPTHRLEWRSSMMRTQTANAATTTYSSGTLESYDWTS